MLGMGDFWIFLVYVLCIASTLACVIYGIINWNKGTDIDEPETEKEWEDTERDITDKLEI